MRNPYFRSSYPDRDKEISQAHSDLGGCLITAIVWPFKKIFFLIKKILFP
jgi:hypothetical protein